MRRLLLSLVALGGVLVGVVVATPASADPARPTNDRSTVVSVEPAIAGLIVTVEGGDAFLRVQAPAGHVVIVKGYRGEPYLRFSRDGTVSQNLESPAVSLNSDRFGAGAEADDVDPEAPPRWSRVASGGDYAWHDHRVHWMQMSMPPGLENGVGLISEWRVDLEVDGHPVVVNGELHRLPARPPWGWLALAAVTAMTVSIAGWRRPALAAGSAALLGCALAVALGWADSSIQPLGSVETQTQSAWFLPALALLPAVTGLGLRRRRPAAAMIATALATATLAMWALGRLDRWSAAVVPSAVQSGIDRGATAVVAGLVAATGLLLVESGRVDAARSAAGGSDQPAETAA